MVVTIDFWVTVAIVVIRVTNVPKVSRLPRSPLLIVCCDYANRLGEFHHVNMSCFF